MLGYMREDLSVGQTVWVVWETRETVPCDVCKGVGVLRSEITGITYGCPHCERYLGGMLQTDKVLCEVHEVQITGWYFSSESESNMISFEGEQIGGSVAETSVFTNSALAEACAQTLG